MRKVVLQGDIVAYDDTCMGKGNRTLTMTSMAKKKHGEGSGVSQWNMLLFVTVTFGWSCNSCFFCTFARLSLISIMLYRVRSYTSGRTSRI